MNDTVSTITARQPCTARRHDTDPSRALVLGGGGITGIGWEVGVLVGLQQAGVQLGNADAIIGTSAGAFVGAALASGHELEDMLAAQSPSNATEISAAASADILAAWYDAFAVGGNCPQRVGAAFGRIAKSHPEPVPRAQRRVVEARLVTQVWPDTLRVTAIDADTDTDKLHVFDHQSAIALVDALSASGAVPGIWPLEHAARRSWVDGGMVSAANARLADGYDTVVVIAPMPHGYGAIPGAVDDVATTRAHADVILVAPDGPSVAAVGPNPYDPDRYGLTASAGRAQGAALAQTIAAAWCNFTDSTP